MQPRLVILGLFLTVYIVDAWYPASDMVCQSNVNFAEVLIDFHQCHGLVGDKCEFVCEIGYKPRPDTTNLTCLAFAGDDLIPEYKWNFEYPCIECSGNTYGVNYNSNCDCVHVNTVNASQSCYTATGQCKCTLDWMGSRCDEDIDECMDELDDFHTQTHQECHNTNNGYLCLCSDGYTRDDNNNCV